MADLNVYEKIQAYIIEHNNDSDIKGKSETEIASIMLSRGVLSEADYQVYQQTSLFGTGYVSPSCFDLFEHQSSAEIGIYEGYALNRLNQNNQEARDIVAERDKEGGLLSWMVNAGHELDAITDKGGVNGIIVGAANPLATVVSKLLFNSENAKSTIENAILESEKDFEYLQKIANGEDVRTDYVRTAPITFQEAWLERRGVEFNENAIRTCEEKSQIMARVNATVDKLNSVKTQIRQSVQARQSINTSPSTTATALIQAFNFAGITKLEDMNNILADIESIYANHPNIKKYGGDLRFEKDSSGKYVIKCTTANGERNYASYEQLKLISNELCNRVNRTIAEGLGVEFSDKTTSKELEELINEKVSEVKTDYEASFAQAYGEKDLKLLAQRYVEKQQQGVANIQMATNIASMALMISPGVLVASSGWLLKGSLALKAAKGISFVNKAKSFARATEMIQKVSQALSPVIMANMTLNPLELVEQLSSENGMTPEEWEAWSIGVLQNTAYMAAGMGASQLAARGASMFRANQLVKALKESGKSMDEIMAMIKSNPVKFDPKIVQQFQAIDRIAVGLQVSYEIALDAASTYFVHQAFGNGDLTKTDWMYSIAFALSGGVLQKQFAPLTTEAKVKQLKQAFRDFELTDADARNILQTMDDISAGKRRVRKQETTPPEAPKAETEDSPRIVEVAEDIENPKKTDEVIIETPTKVDEPEHAKSSEENPTIETLRLETEVAKPSEEATNSIPKTDIIDDTSRLSQLSSNDSYSNTLLNSCKIKGIVSEAIWQKALELDAMGYNHKAISEIIQACLIKGEKDQFGFNKTIGFNMDAYTKAKSLITEHKINVNCVADIINACTKDNEIMESSFNNVLLLKDKINHKFIYGLVEYPDNAINDILELKNKYNIYDGYLPNILKSFLTDTKNKSSYSRDLLLRAENILAEHNLDFGQTTSIINMSKLNGSLDETLCEKVIDMYKNNVRDVYSMVSACTKTLENGEKVFNYRLLEKAQEWQKLGIEDIFSITYKVNELDIDVYNSDIIPAMKKSRLTDYQIESILANQEFNTEVPIRDLVIKVIQLKNTGMQEDVFDSTMRVLGFSSLFGVRLENIDVAIQMVGLGIEKPYALLNYIKDNQGRIDVTKAQDALNYLKEGIDEVRIRDAFDLERKYFDREARNITIELARRVEKDYNYFYYTFKELADNLAKNKELTEPVFLALQNAAKTEDIVKIIDESFYRNRFASNMNYYDYRDLKNNIQAKMLAALAEYPDKINSIISARQIAENTLAKDLSTLDVLLRHPDNYKEVFNTLHAIYANSYEREYGEGPVTKRIQLFKAFDEAQIPVETTIKVIDSLWNNYITSKTPMADEVATKIAELCKQNKLDESMLDIIDRFPLNDSRCVELFDEIVRLKDEGKILLDDYVVLSNGGKNYSNFSSILTHSVDNKLTLLDNYKEILDYYINNKNFESDEKFSVADIMKMFARYYPDNSKMDLETVNKIKNLVVTDKLISELTAVDLIKEKQLYEFFDFMEKADIENYRKEFISLAEYLKDNPKFNTENGLLQASLTSREVNYLLDLQRLLGEENNLKNSFIRIVTEGEISDVALDRIRYYIEMEVEEARINNREANLNFLNNIFKVFKNNPERINDVEKLIFDRDFDIAYNTSLIQKLSDNGEILDKQLEIANLILEFFPTKNNEFQILDTFKNNIGYENELSILNLRLEVLKKLKNKVDIFTTKNQKQDLLTFVRMVDEGNSEVANILLDNKQLKWDEKTQIIAYTNELNSELAKILIQAGDVKYDNLTGILNNTKNETTHAQYITELYQNGKFPKEKLGILAQNLHHRFDLAKEIIEAGELTADEIIKFLEPVNISNIDYARNLIKNYQRSEMQIDDIVILIEHKEQITYRQLQKLKKTIGKDNFAKLTKQDVVIASQFAGIYGRTNINEIPMEAKKDVLRALVACNEGLFNISPEMQKMFPMLPTDRDAYCSLLPSIVRSLGIETNTLTSAQTTKFNQSLTDLSGSLAKISDTDFADLRITQEYSKDDFIRNVLNIVKDLPTKERQKVYDYFGFELHHNKGNQTGFSITGYPVNLNNGKKLAQITDPRTKEIVELLRPEVIKFSEQNPIKCNNPQIEQLLNDVVDVLPELRAQIGKSQHDTHKFDILQHSLKVMQKISQDPKFKELNESDQKVMMLASLLHDITKREGSIDKTHANESAFDTFFIAKKFNLSREEEIKLYTLAKHHEWLEYVNTSKSEEQLTKRLQSVAYDLQNDNLFDMALIFTHADLRAVKVDDTFHDTTIGSGRISFDGTVRSYGESADVYAKRIQNYIQELQKSQPLLPVTKIPAASRIAEAITIVRPDGSTNIKGVYKDKDGLIVIKYNEVEDWEAIGFPKGSISRGIEAKQGMNYGDAALKEEVNTGNIKFFVHGLDFENQLAKFDAFGLVDSEALLSISYAERPESKYRFFRAQGVLLDFDTKYIHGGGNTDAGSGCEKFISKFKNNYIFGGARESDRLYISNLIKNATGMNDAEYVEFVKANENKSLLEIEPIELREKLIRAYASINSNTRKGERAYNEMYGSNPSRVMGVFAYNTDYKIHLGNPIEFLNGRDAEKYAIGQNANPSSVYKRTEFLRRYALEHDIPFVVFGD